MEVKHFCSFDIVGSTFKLATDAEVLKVVSEVLKQFTPKKGASFVVRVNHTGIIKEALNMCHIDERYHGLVCAAINSAFKTGFSAQHIKKQLREKNFPLTDDTFKRLQHMFSLKGQLHEVYEKLANTFRSREVLTELASFIGHFDVWPSMRESTIFDMCCTYNYGRYNGILFTVSIESNRPTIVAYGGRYNRLCQAFNVFGQKPPSVAGICFKLDKFIGYTNMNSGDIPHFSSGVPDTIVTSIGIGMLPERMRVANELWNAHIKAYVHSLQQPFNHLTNFTFLAQW